MNNLNLLFCKRIGFPFNKKITFENLHVILEKTAKTIPFENLRIIENRTCELTKQNIVNKILVQNEGGICYELNSLLYLVLIENGIDAVLIRGTVYDHNNQKWSATGKTHAAILIAHNGNLYLADTGFGGNLPLKPVPLNGEIVTSNNGVFRVDKRKSEQGDYIFYMKLIHKDKDWRIGYAFDSREKIKDINQFNDVQKLIIEHPESSFNKKPLMTKLTDKGNMTLTGTTYIEWIDGAVEKEEVNEMQFKKIAKENFNL